VRLREKTALRTIRSAHAIESLHLRPREARLFLFAASRHDSRRGMTLIELIVAFTILLILSTMALPLARVRVQREKERRLRDALSEMRKAIDRYKDYADAGKLGQVDPDSHGYPKSLEELVEGVEISETGDAMAMGMQGAAGNFGQPAGSRSNRSGFGSNRGGLGSSRGGSSRGGFGSSGGFGSRGGGFGQSGRGSNSRGGMGSAREGTGGIGATGDPGRGDSDDEPKKVRFLRRIPVDPITGTSDWGLRSVQDPPESMSWGGRNVFDVYSKSMETALDGTHYSEW
jgi:prepilin-type N-terminal cleavage/methylation domain-containing protein